VERRLRQEERMRTRRLALVPVLIIIALSLTPLYAGSSTAQMNVSVRVIARTILAIDSQPPTVEVTAADIQRGYLDVPQAVSFRVRSNARDGYSLGFQEIAFPFASAEVQWGGQSAVVEGGAWSGVLSHPYQQGGSAGSLSVRLRIAPGAEPGSYAWPVQVTASSL
jgi:hypothetical protein